MTSAGRSTTHSAELALAGRRDLPRTPVNKPPWVTFLTWQSTSSGAVRTRLNSSLSPGCSGMLVMMVESIASP